MIEIAFPSCFFRLVVLCGLVEKHNMWFRFPSIWTKEIGPNRIESNRIDGCLPKEKRKMLWTAFDGVVLGSDLL